MHVRGADLTQQRLAFFVESHERLMSRAVINRYRTPPEFRADAGRKTFRHRFFRGKSRGVVLVRVFHARAIYPLFLRKYAIEKPLPLPFEHPADTFHLDNIGADADENAAGGKLEVHGGSSE